MHIKIRVVRGPAVDQEAELEVPAMVGRSRTARLRLGHSLVSRRHCELIEQDGALYVRDLGSLNGTFVGKVKIEQPALLAPGTTFSVGPVSMRVDYQPSGPLPEAATSGSEPDALGTTGIAASLATSTAAVASKETDDIAYAAPSPPCETAALDEVPLEFELVNEPDASAHGSESGVDVFADSEEPAAAGGSTAAATSAAPITPSPVDDDEAPFEFVFEEDEEPPAKSDDGLSGFLRSLE